MTWVAQDRAARTLGLRSALSATSSSRPTSRGARTYHQGREALTISALNALPQSSKEDWHRRVHSSAQIQVSEKANIAVVIAWPAMSRGAGLPRSVRPLTAIEASWHPMNRLGM